MQIKEIGQPGGLSRRNFTKGMLSLTALALASGITTSQVFADSGQSAKQSPYNILESSGTRRFLEEYSQKYGLSCEMAALKMALYSYGIDISEDWLLNNIPLNSNPNLGIRGDERRRYQTGDDYGILEPGLESFINGGFRFNDTGFKANNLSIFDSNGNFDPSQMLSVLKNGQPIIAWVTEGLATTKIISLPLSNGGYIQAPADEHAVLIDGYDSRTNRFRLEDPWRGWWNDTIAEYPDTAQLVRSMSYYPNPVMSIEITDRPTTSGHFYRQRSMDKPNQGFKVESSVWSLYQELGRENTLEYPMSQLSGMVTPASPYLYQVFGQGVVQYDTRSGQSQIANVFDDIHNSNKDGELEELFNIPPALDINDGSNGNLKEATTFRKAWLTNSQIKDRYLTNPKTGQKIGIYDAEQLWGLPTSMPIDKGDFIVQRFERTAIQFWKVKVGPNMPDIGSTTHVNTGEIVQRLNLYQGVNYSPIYAT